jgi:hypothetical protein
MKMHRYFLWTKSKSWIFQATGTSWSPGTLSGTTILNLSSTLPEDNDFYRFGRIYAGSESLEIVGNTDTSLKVKGLFLSDTSLLNTPLTIVDDDELAWCCRSLLHRFDTIKKAASTH